MSIFTSSLLSSFFSCLPRRIHFQAFLTFVGALVMIPGGAASAQSVAAGGSQTAVLRADGTLWVWGNNESGQLGMPGEGNQLVPVRLGSREDWASISVGGAHMAAIRSDGTLWTWGHNFEGELGRGEIVTDPYQPKQVGTEKAWGSVAAGGGHTLAIKEDGSLWSFGGNYRSQLGDGTTVNRAAPVRIGTANDWLAVTAGQEHSLGIRTGGTLWAWGGNLDGQVGIGSAAFSQPTPIQVGTATNWSGIAAGGGHSLAIRTDGSLWAWGRALEGQLGFGSGVFSQRTPVRVGTGATWSQITAGQNHSVALQQNGTLWAWGDNFYGQVGGGSLDFQRTPVRVGIRSDWTHIAAGSYHTVALGSDGVLWATGLNAYGQLGTADMETRRQPTSTYFGMPDLVLTGLMISGELTPGSSFPVNLFVSNIGSGPVRAEKLFPIELVLSPVAEWGNSETISLGSFSLERRVESGEGFNLVRDVTFPTAVTSGTYYLGARINGSGNVDESNGENNIFWNAEPVEFLADLQVGTLLAPTSTYQRGRMFSITVPVHNTGLGAIPADVPVTLRVRLTKNKLWGEDDDIVLHNAFPVTGGLPAGTVRTVNLTVTIPESAPLGDFHLAAEVSVAGVLEEVNTDNNRGWSDGNTVKIEGMSLEKALDLPGQLWVSGGDGLWFGREDASGFELDVAQTPPLVEGQHSYLQAAIEGPAVVRFSWKASTERAENYLSFLIDGVERKRLTGNTPWHEEAFLVSGGVNQLRWFYEQGAVGPGDTAWLDHVWVTPVTQPDLVIQELQYEAGERVLQRDQLVLTAIGRNQGASVQLPSNFEMEVRLSRNRIWGDGDDIVLGYMNRLQDLDADNRFVYQASLTLPDSISAGDYYVGVFADSTDVIAEFDEENNVGWSTLPDVKIVRLPDLRVTNLLYENGYYVIHRFDEEKDELTLSFDIENVGLADAAGGFGIQIALSPDRKSDSENKSILSSVVESPNLPAGRKRTFRATIEIPEGVRIGEYQYLMVVVDPDGTLRQSNTKNDSALSDDADIFVSEYDIDFAVNNPGTRFRFFGVPWFGQSEESHDGHSAAQSGRIGDFGMSAMETTVNLEKPSLVSFFWKVSSQFDDQGMDWISFSIDGIGQATIAGEVDWHRVSFPIPAGESVLRWTYQKDESDFDGADSAWVDRLTYHVPDLIVSGLQYDPGNYQAGESVPMTVTILNQGLADVPANPRFEIELRLSRDMVWGTEGDVLLDTFSVAGLAKDETREFIRDVQIPENLTFEGNNYVMAKADTANVVVETSELNNERFSEYRDFHVTPRVTLAEALDDDRNSLPGQWIVGEWTSGGEAPWYGFLHRGLANGSDSSADGEDSARSGVISQGTTSWVERQIEVSPTGPAEVVFRWKASSFPSANSLRFLISGKEKARISGDVDWREERFLIPAGPQVLRWVYVKTNGQIIGEDSGFLDEVRIESVNLPDLAILSVEHGSDVHVLERDRLTVQVVVQNQGTVIAGVLWDTADVEARLSLDDRWGNEDDVILGHFGEVYFDSADNLIFSGDLDLPLDTPAGTYRLAVLVDPHEKIEEFDHDNNFFWSEPEQSIVIERRPNLELAGFDYNGSKRYHPLSQLEVNWTVTNLGLGDVLGGIRLGQRLELRARDTRDAAPAKFSWLSDSIFIKSLTQFSTSPFMPGVSAQKPNGHSVYFQGIFILPDELELLKKLGVLSSEATRSMVGDSHRAEMEFMEYKLVLLIDSEDQVEESDEANSYGPEGLGLLHILPIYESSSQVNFVDWANDYGVNSDTGSSGFGRLLLDYALDLNPNVLDNANQPAPGFVEVDEQEYLRLAFPLVRGATDLRYVVEASSDLANWALLVALQPPYLWSHGPNSLSGVGGLTSQNLVVTAADDGYTARVTVRDSLPTVEAGSGRFLRLRIEYIE